MSRKSILLALFVLLGALALAACNPETVEVIKTVEIVTTVEVPGGVETIIEVVTATPEPVVVEPRTLVICQGQQPDTLYPYGGSMLAMSHVLEALYDGPVDANTYAYQPIILQKLPSLADGDAVINVVDVVAGDLVVDNLGNIGALAADMVVRPAGCNATDCAITYDGTSALQMDQMAVTFQLLPGLTWSDGTPLTSADQLYAFTLNADPDTPIGKYNVEHTASYVATDELTTVWTGLPGYKDSTYFLVYWSPLPEHLWGQYSPADLVTEVDAQSLWLGWGPYTMVEWVKGDHITMAKNPNYFRASEGLPKFETVVYRFGNENSNAAIAGILAGECDIVDQTTGLEDQSELLLELQAAGQINATFITGTTYEHADFNILPVETGYDGFAGLGAAENGVGPFGDVRLRRAVAMCMDRQAVVDTVFFGQSVTIDTYIPPEHPLFNPENTHWPYDPAAAGALLDEIGWLDADGDPATPRVATGVVGVPDGTPLQFFYETTSATQRMQATQIMAESALACGIQMDLNYYPASEWFADGPDGKLFGRMYDLGQFAWLTGVQPSCELFGGWNIPGDPALTDAEGNALYPSGWGGQNNSGYSNPEYDAACLGALQSLPGQESYDANHLLAQKIFSDELPIVPLYLRLKLAATRPDMCNFFMDPTANSEMWNIEEFDYGASCGE